VPSGRYVSVVEKLRPGARRPGDIVHVDGRVLGRHDGVIGYTVGQRRGLGVATGEPLFVVRIDAAGARVIVGPREALLVASIGLKDVNWIGPDGGDLAAHVGRPVLARVRSTREPVPAKIGRAGGTWTIDLDTPEEGVAPGQACVFYDPYGTGTRVLGGGWIAGTVSAAA
jgi:tRNA-uridine 2-sulfurtransferase